MKNCIFYIDPQSYKNLAVYDYNLLSNMKCETRFYGSKYYDAPKLPKNIIFKPVFKYNKMSNSIAKALSYLLSYSVILIHILRYRPHTIHLQWFKIEKLDYLLYSLLHLVGIRIVFTAHNVLPHDTGDKYANIYKKIYHLVDDIIVHAANTKHEIANKFDIPQDKIHIVNHGLLQLDINTTEYETQRHNFEKKYQIDKKIIFTSLGEQSKYKGIDILIKIWSETPELYNNNDIQLILAGKIKNLDLSPLQDIKNVIIKDSRISNEEFYFVLTHTDVYLLPYRIISQSGALLTAMTYHVPSLVTNKGGLADPLSVAKVGWCIDDCDYKSLKDALLWLSRHHNEIKDIKNDKTAWMKIEEEYNWGVIAQKTSELYDRKRQ